ncbi:TPA: TetR/AcrR family transcriptional regulator [Burkholderia cenocepacia]|uniref:TetR/AcrR family transcriptional regulator n=1 Tax=unclassified Burkholderia TaxID=2613784 RepID=UPI00158E46CC|nr:MULTISPECIES: TetR/AcrR family transcriptional regulator [unclassified Burkholderia]HEF5875077.1 TetR/AcrR family transcriptional regulator [Burkholderia cenocepacia]
MTQGTGSQRASRSSKAQAGKSTARASSDKPYHHGALPQALLDAAEIVLRRDGMRGLTLRAISREAGVSHTAAQHHFGDMSGVLSELAASGHRRLASALSSATENVKAMHAGRQAVAHAYVRFAVDNPDLFRLMSRNELLDATRPALAEARRINARALARLHGIDDASARDGDQYGGPDIKQAIGMTSAWAFVHGLASLLIDGRLNALASATEGVRDAADLVSAAIEHIRLVQSTSRDDTKQR